MKTAACSYPSSLCDECRSRPACASIADRPIPPAPSIARAFVYRAREAEARARLDLEAVRKARAVVLLRTWNSR